MKPIKLVLGNKETIKEELFEIIDRQVGIKECRVYEAKDYILICMDKEVTNLN